MLMICPTAAHRGYIFLITILVIGAIASATAVSLLLLGWAAEQNGLLVMQSAQAYEYAQACAETVITNLREDNAYEGGETVEFDSGSCAIHMVGGSGSFDRIICVEGLSGDSSRKIEISVAALYPSASIASWQEVSDFTLCP